ncbi:zinc finger protein 658B-like [Lineus longissimus]|uniref:zinc finger protein 658B-like n=1 Tax=Lineus longissimus TaxID=88925 RepID=UPI002B4D99C2
MTNDALHACAFCPKAFPASRDLRRHILVHTGERPYKCDQCDRRFARRDNMRLHIRNVHYGERTWLKTHRKKKVVNLMHEANLQSPNDYNPNMPKYQCSQCEKMFYSQRSLNMHMTIHNRSTPLICGQCNKHFAHIGTLNLHLAAHVREKAQHYNCKLCPQRFHKQEHLQTHMLIHSGEVVTYPDGEMVTYPDREVVAHPDGEMVAQPDEEVASKPEGVVYTTPVTLKRRRQSHTGGKVFECDTCEKKFSDQRKLAIHVLIKTHSGKVPYECKQCGKSFNSVAGLKRHKTVMHKKENKSVYSERLNSKGNLRAHARTHSGSLMTHISRILNAHSGGVLEAHTGRNTKVRSERKSKSQRNVKALTPVQASSGEEMKELISGILKANTGRTLKSHIVGNARSNVRNVSGRIPGNFKRVTDTNGNFKAQANRNLKSHFAGNLKAKIGRSLPKPARGNLKSHFAGSMSAPTLPVQVEKLQISTNSKTPINGSIKIQNKKASGMAAEDNKFKCKKCTKSFSFAGLLKRHAKIHNQEPLTLNASVKSEAELTPVKTEVVDVVNKGEIQIECEHCGKHFSLQSYYDLHCKIMHRNLVKTA